MSKRSSWRPSSSRARRPARPTSDKVCGDAELRRQVERLLALDARASGFLASARIGADGHDRPASTTERARRDDRPLQAAGADRRRGHGRRLRRRADRAVRREVALKVIKPGMDTRQVIARFEAERQALAMMDHPNIAKVLDAGTTEAGRPYFVMELVRGMPITEYCDKDRLAVRASGWSCSSDVCQAVQHAHQKGIIHRDLKPSNILVTLHDGTPVPKVIDFGVAKALGQQLTEQTLYTGLTQLVGTPLYMSPEQAEMNRPGCRYAQRRLLARRAALRAA